MVSLAPYSVNEIVFHIVLTYYLLIVIIILMCMRSVVEDDWQQGILFSVFMIVTVVSVLNGEVRIGSVFLIQGFIMSMCILIAMNSFAGIRKVLRGNTIQ